MSDISALIDGFSKFQADYRLDKRGKYRELLARGQTPEIMMIACCDSRVDPAIITNSEAGDILVVRNIANLVPPYSPQGNYQEMHAAIEYGVCYLRVKHMIIMGHSRCGGIRSLMTRMMDDFDPSHPMDEWTSVAEPIARAVMQRNELENLDDKVCACSRETLALGLENLRTYPWVDAAVAAGKLALHGWYFNMSNGMLEKFNPEDGTFSTLS